MKNINLLNHSLNFVAVILGVFLAFYVDSCNERIKEEVELKEIIESLLDDLESDHETYRDYQIPKNEKQSKELEELIADVLGLSGNNQGQLSVNFEVENYSPVSSTYLSINSSGKINLFDDLKIKKELSNYYDILSQESMEKGEIQVEFFLNEILPWMIENTNLMDVSSEELRGEKKLANRIILYRTLIQNKTAQYRVIDKASLELQKMLMEYLEK